MSTAGQRTGGRIAISSQLGRKFTTAKNEKVSGEGARSFAGTKRAEQTARLHRNLRRRDSHFIKTCRSTLRIYGGILNRRNIKMCFARDNSSRIFVLFCECTDAREQACVQLQRGSSFFAVLSRAFPHYTTISFRPPKLYRNISIRADVEVATFRSAILPNSESVVINSCKTRCT